MEAILKAIFTILPAILFTTSVFAAGSKNQLSKLESLQAVAGGIQWAVSNQSELPDVKSPDSAEKMSGYSSLQILANLNQKLVNVKRTGIVSTKLSDQGVDCRKAGDLITCEALEFFKDTESGEGGGSFESYRIELKVLKHADGYKEFIVTKTEAMMAG